MASNSIKMDYSIVIPVYNSEKSLFELYKRIKKVMESQNKNFEIILVDDCSSDGSWKILQDIHKKDKRVKVIQLTKNFGQHNAIMCGFSFTKGNYIITMDDDLQHPPEEIPHLIETIKDGYKIVYGQYKSKQHGWFRNTGSKLVFKILSRVTGNPLNVTSFRIIKKEVIDAATKFDNYYVVVDVVLANIVSTKDITHCTVEHHARKYGKTSYSIYDLVLFASNVIFNFTVLPLRFATFVGIFFSFISLALGIYLLVLYKFHHISVSGYTSLILSITFFSGIILFVLGIIGEYIGRIFLSIGNRPQYLVNEARL